MKRGTSVHGMQRMSRRRFLHYVGAGGFASYALGRRAVASTKRSTPSTLDSTSSPKGQPSGDMRADVVIVGGGLGGVAAALAAVEAGVRVLLVEETEWLGGQITNQGVPPDENPWVETFGATHSYQALRERVRAYYRENYPLTPQARGNPQLNPGNGWVSRLCHEPRVALACIEALLAPWSAGGRLQILRRHRCVRADRVGDAVVSVLLRNVESGATCVVEGRYFIDATELGDLLPLTGTAFRVGAESRRDTGEPHAAEEGDSHNVQAFTWCFPLAYDPEGDHTISRPERYGFWREYVPTLVPPWPGRLLSLTATHPVTLEPREFVFDPRGTSAGDKPNLWLYRRIVDKTLFQAGHERSPASDITIVNWPQNDYWLGSLFDDPAFALETHGETVGERAPHGERAKELGLCLLYWLQTEAPRLDGGTGWRGLYIPREVFGTADGFARYPYVRESRRMVTLFTVTENHVGYEARRSGAGTEEKPPRPEYFADSVGIGYYRIDLHPTTGGNNYLDIDALPFQIPLGAMLSVNTVNVLPGGKTLGTTHITNGCYRLHPVEWNVGEAAGALAAYCIECDIRPHDVCDKASHRQRFQERLRNRGVRLEWPEEVFARRSQG